MAMSEAYEKRNFNQGPSTYFDEDLLNKIHAASGLEAFQGEVVFDLMAGSGKVALGMQERSPGNKVIVLDSARKQLDNITSPIMKILRDVRDIEFIADGLVDVALVRYGIKDIPQEQQLDVLKQIRRIVKPGGKLIVTDMMSPVGMRDWNIMQHSRKQELGGRKISEEGQCYIPEEQEWLDLLRDAGFLPEVFGYYTSRVKTMDWVTGEQITDEQRPIMDTLLLNAPDEIRDAFNIRQEGQDVKIDAPVIIIKAMKPQVIDDEK